MRRDLGMVLTLCALGLVVLRGTQADARPVSIQPVEVVTWDQIVQRDALRLLAAPATPSQPSGSGIDTSFAALGDNGVAIPPDTMGAVGPSHLMTMLNSQVRIQDKAGRVISTVALSSFWTASSGLAAHPFDPHVVYDSLGGRWLATVGANRNTSASQIWLAVSATSDPTGTWSFYGIVADPDGTTWADYPGFGVNSSWVAITTNMFTIASVPGFVGAKMWVIDKSTAGNGGALIMTVFPTGFDASPGGTFGFSLRPALTLSRGEATLYIVDNTGLVQAGTQLVRLSRITGTGPAPIWSVVPGSSIAGTGLFPVAHNFDPTQIGAPQSGTTTTVDTGDIRASDAMVRNGSLWFAHSGGLPVGQVDRTAVFWYQLDPTAMPSPIVQSGVLDGGAGVHHFFPSIAANAADDALIGFSRSDATRFVEAVTSERSAGDAPGTMLGPTVLKAGESDYEKDFGSGTVRWGDFSATRVDPADDLTLWTIQEYAAAEVGSTAPDDRWGTWWGTKRVASTTTTTTATITTTSSKTTTTRSTPSSTATTTTRSSTSTTATAVATTSTASSTPSTASTTTLMPLCAATAATGCGLAEPGASVIRIKARHDASKNRFRWQWTRGAATVVSDFDDPVRGSPTYSVCVYDGSTDVQPLMRMDVPPGATCGKTRCWKGSGPLGFSYRNTAGTPNGLTSLKLKAGATDHSSVQARGRGPNLPAPTLAFVLPVTVQLVIGSGSTTRCWQTTYVTAIIDTASQFSARGPSPATHRARTP